jgi:hypothetical protein
MYESDENDLALVGAQYQQHQPERLASCLATLVHLVSFLQDTFHKRRD